MSLYDIEVQTIDGKKQKMDAYKGKVLLIVNVASQCGFTPQYKGLEALYQAYRDEGLVVLGFPCNQFGSQEPGTEKEIQDFCKRTYDVSFPLFTKIEVNGANTHPLYAHLKKSAPGLLGTESVKWNFTKFLVDKEGKVKNRFAPKDAPESMASEIEAVL